ncbi:hypothetical protein [Pseudoduganella sp.]|uniref:hypothetical protein n=1 Tax=Pseudoduganella sp. TaxID=1880898 RepID=UPI0035B050B5
MKNKLFDIFSGFALTLPLAMLAGVVALGVDGDSGALFLAATGSTLLLAWPALSQFCHQGRQRGRRHTFRLRLIAGLLLLPPVASAVMFGMVRLPSGYAGGVCFLIMCVAGGTTVFLGWLGAAIVYAFGGREAQL